jgi:hypothetical protein
LGPNLISLTITFVDLDLIIFSLFFCSYRNFLYSITLQTGGVALGDISTRSNSNSLAICSALLRL